MQPQRPKRNVLDNHLLKNASLKVICEKVESNCHSKRLKSQNNYYTQIYTL